MRNLKVIVLMTGLTAMAAITPLSACKADPTQRQHYEMTIPKDTKSVTGTVVEIDVGGSGENSAQLEFTLEDKSKHRETFAVWVDTEPQVFASMTTILTMAYTSNKPVTATLVATGDTPRAVNIRIPADGK